MKRGLVISILMAVIALFAVAEGVSAQELSRDRLRGNVRTINNGGLVPIDSAALLRAQAEAAARRDSLYYHYLDSIGRLTNELYDNLADDSRDSIRRAVAETLKRDSMVRSRGDSITADGRRIRLNKNGEPRKPFISDSMGLSKMCWLSLPLPGTGKAVRTNRAIAMIASITAVIHGARPATLGHSGGRVFFMRVFPFWAKECPHRGQLF